MPGGQKRHLGAMAVRIGKGAVGIDGIPAGGNDGGKAGARIETAVEHGDGNGRRWPAAGRAGSAGRPAASDGGPGRQAGHVVQFGVGDERMAGQLLQKRFDVGPGREADEIDAGGGIRFHDHAADFIEQALELLVGGAGAHANEQFVLDEFGRGAEDAPGGIELRRFFGNWAGGGFAARA